MKNAPVWVATVALLLAAGLSGVAQDTANKPAETKRVAADKPPSLRKPGFIFVELGTQKIDDYISFFEDVAEFKLVHHENGYADMMSDHAQLMFMDPRGWPNAHPFYAKCKGSDQGLGVEIGIVLEDVRGALQKLSKHPTWKLSTGIVFRPWGVHDFRVLSPDGYYIRFTEGPKSGS